MFPLQLVPLVRTPTLDAFRHIFWRHAKCVNDMYVHHPGREQADFSKKVPLPTHDTDVTSISGGEQSLKGVEQQLKPSFKNRVKVCVSGIECCTECK